ncbi:MAG: hypothetical protein N2441_10570 [Rhodocyclaceae bacterium]|nr:hypothetical protein [Rhodocyclaceae bacterium]
MKSRAHAMLFFACALATAGGWAADFACLEQCLRQGHARAYCFRVCEAPSTGGLESQAGVPENPAFRQIRPSQEAYSPPLESYDVKCLEDCRRKGHAYGWCRKLCRY